MKVFGLMHTTFLIPLGIETFNHKFTIKTYRILVNDFVKNLLIACLFALNMGNCILFLWKTNSAQLGYIKRCRRIVNHQSNNRTSIKSLIPKKRQLET